MKSFFDQSKHDLLAWVERPARASRAFQAVYRDRAQRFDEIEGLPPAVRGKLREALAIDAPEIRSQYDSTDGTQRCLMQLGDGDTVESVMIPADGRVTFCISSQIGCGMGCTFCLTGRLGLIRNLSVGEIVSQVVALDRETAIKAARARFSVVLMGMGEPLHNYDNVIKAIGILCDPHGFALPPSRITLSTAGLVPEIQRLAQEAVFPNLSISLTGVTNAARDVLMPINRKYPIEAVIETLRQLPPARQSRVMMECVMIRDVTDSPDDARRLAALLRGLPVKVNLIPFNAADELPFQRSEDSVILRFQKVLLEHGTATFIRKTRGRDVYGACGQLKKMQPTVR